MRSSRWSMEKAFTLLELLLILTILGSVSLLAWPRIGMNLRENAMNSFRYRLTALSSQMWRDAQIAGKTLSLRFEPGLAYAEYDEESIRVYYPNGYRPYAISRWTFPWNDYVANEPLVLVCGADTLSISCVANVSGGRP